MIEGLPVGAPRDEVAQLRVPPHSVEAEQSVLGALLAGDPQAFARVSDLISESSFYRHEHRLIFSAIAQIASAGQPIDIVTVAEQLEGEVSDFGGLAYLNALAGSVPSAAHVHRYAEIVAERAVARSVIATADEMATRAFRGDAPAVVLDEMRVAIARMQDQHRPGRSRTRLPVLTGPDLVAASTSMRWLIRGVVPSKSIGVIYGASGTFKSFVGLDMALHVVHGLPWLGRRTSAGKVLWIAAEGGRAIGSRVLAWHQDRKLQVSRDFVGVPASIDLGTDAWRVVDQVQATVGIEPALVVVDTLAQTFTAGGSENDATDMARYLRELGMRFRDLWGSSVLLVHHTGHAAADRPRGSSAIQANTDFLISCQREEKQMLATVECTHQKDGERFEECTFEMRRVDLGTNDFGDRVTSLVARHVASQQDLADVMQAEVNAGRGGKNELLMSLLQNGARESDTRNAFYKACGDMKPDARRQAWFRAREVVMKRHGVEFVNDTVIVPNSRSRA